MNQQIKGHLCMLGANTMWGLMSPVAKLVMSAGIVAPLFLADARIVGAAILFWLLSLVRPYEHVPAPDLLRLAGAAMLSILFNQGCFIVGVGYTSPGEASIITTTMPMWVMVFGALFFGQKLTVRKLLGIALGGIGALTLIISGMSTAVRGNNPVLGDILVLCAQMSYATYLLIYRNFIKRYSLVTLMKWMFTFASVGSLAISFRTVVSMDYSALDTPLIAGIAYVVVGGTFLAYVFMTYGQKTLRPEVVGMYNYLQPIVALMVGLTLGLDRFSPLKGLAIVMIFSGVYIVATARASESPEKSRISPQAR